MWCNVIHHDALWCIMMHWQLLTDGQGLGRTVGSLARSERKWKRTDVNNTWQDSVACAGSGRGKVGSAASGPGDVSLTVVIKCDKWKNWCLHLEWENYEPFKIIKQPFEDFRPPRSAAQTFRKKRPWIWWWFMVIYGWSIFIQLLLNCSTSSSSIFHHFPPWRGACNGGAAHRKLLSVIAPCLHGLGPSKIISDHLGLCNNLDINQMFFFSGRDRFFPLIISYRFLGLLGDHGILNE